MKISVITICYNNISELKSTIESVTNQTYKDMEYIIKSFVEYAVNPYSLFHFRVKDIYGEDEAHITPNDVRMVKVS